MRAPQYRTRLLPISALVDSGSPWTSLAPLDSKMLNVPIKALRRATNHPRIMFAGDEFWRLLMNNIELYLKDQNGEIVKLELPSVTVLDPIRKTPAEEYRGIPSVIGVNFIRIHKMALHLDLNKNIAVLESSKARKGKLYYFLACAFRLFQLHREQLCNLHQL
jgi:hypothetical protein